jgi:hypothetical protein
MPRWAETGQVHAAVFARAGYMTRAFAPPGVAAQGFSIQKALAELVVRVMTHPVRWKCQNKARLIFHHVPEKPDKFSPRAQNSQLNLGSSRPRIIRNVTTFGLNLAATNKKPGLH